MRHLPSFSALRAFEAAARFGSFKEAADALNLSTSAISHQIRTLEKELGQVMFERHANGVILTESARLYLTYIRSAFDQLEKGTELIQQNQSKNALRISLLSTLSTLWLIPRLPQFNRLFPNTKIELVDHSELIDFSISRVDAAIRYDFSQKGEWKGLVAHPLIDEYVFPVCSRTYLEEHPEVVELKWNSQHTLLLNSRHPTEWETWLANKEKKQSKKKTGSLPSVVTMDTSNMTLMAAKNGLGIALGRTPFVDQFIENSELVRIHQNVHHRGTRHFLVYPADHANHPKLIQFRDWLITTSAKCNKRYSESLNPNILKN
ncbi:MAG: LysR family transcriptional regulator [Acidiferrobacterales bacterium]|nr:LysR family transcriptional regulator [Acidiferrobacterales bacterium]